jgi:glycine/D-amino acid oxidase-like deaminating enzyme
MQVDVSHGTRTVLSSSDPQLTTGSPYWPERNDTREGYPELTDDLLCDVVVIGGGITGALVAYRMIRAGLGTVLVDKGRFGSGSTSASTALIGYEFDLMLSDLAGSIGERAAVRAYKLCYDATSRIKELVHELEDPCDYEDKVSIRITNAETDFESLKKESSLRNRHGFGVELVEREVLQSRFGITAKLGLVSDNAAQIDPLKLTHLLIDRGARHGLQAFERTRVTTFESTKKEVKLKTAQGFSIRAKHVIFATGYESEKYLGNTKSQLTTDFCFISHPLKSMGKLAKCHVVENAEDYLYLSTFGNRVMVGLEGKSFYYPGERSRLMARRIRELLERVEVYLPNLKISAERHWASTFANSADSLPYIGTVDRLPGAIFALGYGGNGIASSAMLSPILVDLVLNEKNPDAEIFRLDR